MARPPSDFLTQGIGRFIEGSRYNREQAQQEEHHEEAQQQDVIQQGIQGLRAALTQGAQQTEMQKRLAAQMELEQMRAGERAGEALLNRRHQERMEDRRHQPNPERDERTRAESSARVDMYKARAERDRRPPQPRPVPPGRTLEGMAAREKEKDFALYMKAVTALEGMNSREAEGQTYGVPPVEKKRLVDAITALEKKHGFGKTGAPKQTTVVTTVDDDEEDDSTY